MLTAGYMAARLLLLCCFYATVNQFGKNLSKGETSQEHRLTPNEATMTDARPIEWSPGQRYEGAMYEHITTWLTDHPEKNHEDKATYIRRTIYNRIKSNLRNPTLSAYDPQILYSTVWHTIQREKDLSEIVEYQMVFDEQWAETVSFFGANFTEPPRTDS